jgi:Subtilase family
MPGFNDRDLPHLFIGGRTEGVSFTNPASGGGGESFPPRDRVAHADRLAHELDVIHRQDNAQREARTAIGLPTDYGLVVEFASHPGWRLPEKKLDRPGNDIALLNIRIRQIAQPGGQTIPQEFATVRIPFGKLSVFERLVTTYRDEDTGKGKPKNEPLIAPIESIRRAALDAFWTDRNQIPQRGVVADWEAWLRAGETEEDRPQIRGQFESHCATSGIEILGTPIVLPETTILLLRAAREQLESSIELLDCLCELRSPAVGVAEFDDMVPEEQAEWVSNAVERLVPPLADANAVCILDTGVNHGHPLLAPVIPERGLHTFLPAWGTDDRHENGIGHGTQMAGLAAFGDLMPAMLSSAPIDASHWIESGKIFNDRDEQPQEQWGNIVADTIAAVEQAAPFRKRVFAQQITADNTCFDGRPTSWSSVTDQLCAGVGEDPSIPRLLFVSAGNWDNKEAERYPAINRDWSVKDPAQAWNAVTVGACTHRDRILDRQYAHYPVIAPRGGLSPMSATSCVWNPDWPIKPDIVLEGGNQYNDNGKLWKHPDLELLTTNAKVAERLLGTADGTSAASALAARLAALVGREYPDAWPETLRALMVHSAEWTPAMRDGRNLNLKGEVADMLRHYGHGEPDALRAIRTARSAVTMVVQDEFQPFLKEGGSIKTNEMRYHSLPWPKDVLEDIGAATAEMRVTLSYFIEPNPGPRLTNNRYRYGSCHLRFDVQRPAESPEAFRARVNAEDRENQERIPGGGDSGKWLVGSDTRHRGSLHQDTWRGSAAELASKSCIAVFPVNGWWRLRPFKKCYDRRIRYSLVVSLRSPEQTVDLYTPIAVQLGIPASVEIPSI